ncbi:MAG: nitrilase-related carbon-nitrogen hydrolase [Antricoccus sp.]
MDNRDLTIAVAQPQNAGADLAANVAAHAAAIRSARAQLIIFPELSLTGYDLDRAPVNPQDARLRPLVDACAECESTAIVGAPIAVPGGTGIGALVVDRNGIWTGYIKMSLGDSEVDYVQPGSWPGVIKIGQWRVGIGICTDTENQEHLDRTNEQRIDLYVAGLIHQPDESAQIAARAHHIALAYRIPVAFAAAAGPMGAQFEQTSGGSVICAANGQNLVQASDQPGEIRSTTLTATAVMRDDRQPRPVVPRPAVSVIPVRDGPNGLEVFVQHRVHTMDFAAGVVVFPGGRIDPVDVANPADVSELDLDELVQVWGDSTYVREAAEPRLAVRVVLATGAREMHEETGVLLHPEQMLPWDDWTTPEISPKRFQVYFLVAHIPLGDPRTPRNTTTEAKLSEWLPVDDLLRRNGADLSLMTPTRVILQELADFGSAAAVLGAHPIITPVHLDRGGLRPRQSRRTTS